MDCTKVTHLILFRIDLSRQNQGFCGSLSRVGTLLFWKVPNLFFSGLMCFARSEEISRNKDDLSRVCSHEIHSQVYPIHKRFSSDKYDISRDVSFFKF